MPENKMKKILGHKDVPAYLDYLRQSNRLSHAYVFYGPEDTDKKKIVLNWVRSILRARENSFHPDLLVIDFSSQDSISIEIIRQIKRYLSLKPSLASRKIVVINNAQNLTVEAQQAFLKVFEEPPTYGILILIVPNLASLVGTIISRAVLIRCFPLDRDKKNPKSSPNAKRNLELFTKMVSLPLELRFLLTDQMQKESVEIPDFLKTVLASLEALLEIKIGIKEVSNEKLQPLTHNFRNLEDLAEKIKKIQNIYFKISETNFNPRFALNELIITL